MMKCRNMFLLVFLTGVVLLSLEGCARRKDTDVEFVPTPQPVVEAMLKMASVTKDDVVYDLGCGDGRFVITAAKMFGARALGVDIDPERIKQARAQARKAGVTHLVTFIEGDFFRTDLRKATVVALYLTPELNLRLRPKLFDELRPGARIVSHDFNMGYWKPDAMGRLPDVMHEYPDRTYARAAPHYCWVLPANVAGVWNCKLSTETDERTGTLRLVQQFQEVSGSLTLEGRELPVTDARLAGRQLSFTVSATRDKEKVAMWFAGQVNKSSMEGAVEVQGGERTGNYHWQASLQTQ